MRGISTRHNPDVMKILIVSSEVVPFARHTDLADFAGALPVALSRLGHDVRVITPKYKVTDETTFGLRPVVETMNVPISTRLEPCTILEGRIASEIPIYFIKNNTYYQRDQLYGDSQGDYPDNAERFIYFSRSIAEACKQVNFLPDIIHCNDWQTGLVPVYLRQLHKADPAFANTALVYTIHNLGYQGLFWHYDMHLTGLGWELFTPDGLEYYGKINLMKGGLMWADTITTVSPTYAAEIQTQEHGHGLEGVLQYRSEDLFGIVNGVDYTAWNPETDPHISQNYSASDLSGKSGCKKALLQTLDLAAKATTPVIGMIAPLDNQKGSDLLEGCLERLLILDACFVLAGTGHEKYQKLFQYFADKYPKKFGLRLSSDEILVRKILAGADLLLFPARYEPCGTIQMYSLKYGTIPIVHVTGGLNDTVKTFQANTDTGTGFKFSTYTADALLSVITTALQAYEEKKSWKALMLRAMAEDFSWAVTAQHYANLYTTTLERRMNDA